MTYRIEISQGSDRPREESVSPTEAALDVAPPVVDAPARVDETGVELKRGAFLNTIAMLASNFRGDHHIHRALGSCRQSGAEPGAFSSRYSAGGRAVCCDRCHRHSSAPVF